MLLILASILVGMLIIEIWLRLSSPKISIDHKPLYIADEYGNTIHQKNWDGPFYSTEKKANIQLKTNEEGFIGHDYTIEKATSTFRIAILGDSLVEAVQVDTKNNFISLLEKHLNASRPEELKNKNIEMMNFSIGGQGTFEELRIYKYYVQKYNPDLVFLVFFPNDFENNQYYIIDRKKLLADAQGWKQIDISNANNIQTRSDFKYKLLKNSRLVCRFDSIFRSNAFLHNLAVKIGLQHAGPMGTAKDGIHERFFIYQTPLSKTHSEVYDFTIDLLRYFAKQINEKSKFAIIYLPEATQVDSRLWEDKKKSTHGISNYKWNLEQTNSILREKLEKYVTFFDLTSIYKKYYEENQNLPMYFNRDGHLNEKGHEITAEALENFLIELYSIIRK